MLDETEVSIRGKFVVTNKKPRVIGPLACPCDARLLSQYGEPIFTH